jgi:hypothetical protein
VGSAGEDGLSFCAALDRRIFNAEAAEETAKAAEGEEAIKKESFFHCILLRFWLFVLRLLR